MNPDSCVVLGCRNSVTGANRPKSTCKFMKFPIERKDLTEIWLRKLNLEGWIPGPESLVCDEHFSSDSFEITHNGRVLKPNAVPTVVDELERIILHYELLLRNQFKELSQNPSNTDKLRCRLCTAIISLDDAVDVFSEDENVITKILKCIPNPFCKETQDYLPKHICRLCLSDLNTSYRMLIRAIESEKFFSSLLANKEKSNNEMITLETTGQKMETSHVLADLMINEHCRSRHYQNMSDEEFDLIDSCAPYQIGSFLEDQLEDSRSQFATNEVSNINLNFEDETNSFGTQIRDVLNVSFFHHSPSPEVCRENEKSSTAGQRDTFKCKERITGSEVCLLFTCQYCCTTYESKEILDKHLETHVISVWCEDSKIEETHQENTDIPVNSCKVCLMSFPTQESLMQHSRGVHELKYVGNETVQEFKCKECEKKFKTKLSLTIHERVHTGARPYVCVNCGRSFRSGANLSQHLLIHSGEKKYRCMVCDKAFMRKGSLDVHSRVHTGERPYQCKICKNKYTQVADLRRHERKYHETSSERRLMCGGNSERTKRALQQSFY